MGVHTAGLFVKKGIPHEAEAPVLWARAVNDGLLKSKGKRLPNSRVPNEIDGILPLLRAFIADQSHPIEDVPMMRKMAPVDYADSLLELVPENYLDQDPPSIEEIKSGVEQVLRDSAAFVIRTGREHA